jgi:hypothetical protein
MGERAEGRAGMTTGDAKAHATKEAKSAGKSRKPGRRAFTVHLWVTDLNPTEVGIYRHSRYQAKSRQFTTDMDIIADVSENGERTGLIGYRSELWDNKTGMDRRLVLKLFTPSMNWRATLDMMLGRGLQLTHGAKGIPVPAFSLNLNEHDQVVHLERSASKWPVIPENYSFFLLKDLKDGRPEFYRLRRNWVNIGDDYVLYDEHDRQIGKLNGRVLNIGGKWVVEVDAEHCGPHLEMVLQLFCGMLKFHDDILHHLEDLHRDVKRGKVIPKLETHETDLYMNPRRVR